MSKNRGSSYGETLFTTVGINESALIFWDDHISRLIENTDTFFFLNKLNDHEKKSIETRIYKILTGMDFSIYNAVRINVYLEGDMRFGMLPSFENLRIDCELKKSMAAKSLKMDLLEYTKYSDAELPKPKLNDYFWENYYVRRSRSNGFDDVLFTSEGTITEASTSNIFFIYNKELITPKLSNHILPGIYRKHLMEFAGFVNLKVREMDIKKEDIKEYEGAFLTNSVKGIIPVEKIGSTDFDLSDTLAMIFKIKKGMSEYQTEFTKTFKK